MNPIPKQDKKFYKKITSALKVLLPAVLVIILCGFLSGCGNLTKAFDADNKTDKTEKYDAFTQRDAFNLRQVITADSSTSRTIMWQSDAEEKDAFIEYRTAKAEGAAIQTQRERINEKFTDNGKTTWVHTVTLQNLQPGTKYAYRLGHKDRRSDWYELTTAQGAAYKALIFPDSQSARYKAWEDVAMPAWKRNQDAQFFIAMGDLVDNGEHAYQWNEWFTHIRSMITQIPVVPVLGNHETYTMDWKVRMPQAFLHYFQLPGGAPEKYKNQFYSFDFGDVHFTVLNTQARELDKFQPDMLQEQLAWFRADMEKTKKKWKIVLMHKDVLRYGFLKRKTPREEGFSEEGKVFMPLFDRYKVDVVLTAHLHTYRNRGHIFNFKRDERGPLYILTGVAGDVRYPELWKRHSLDVALAPQPETNNYLVMEADSNSLKFSCYLPDGTKVDEAAVEK